MYMQLATYNQLIGTVIFLDCYSDADTRASDNSDMNPFMIAVEKGHLEVVEAMMKKNPDLVSLSTGFKSTVIHWALEKDTNRSAFFEVHYKHFILLFKLHCMC